MEKVSILERVPLYSDASRELRRRILDVSTCVRLDARQFFYREGDTSEVFAVVGHGDIRVFKTGAAGREITLYHVQDGEACLINMLCTFLARPAMASAQVEAPTECVVISARNFCEWIMSEDSVRNFVFTTMAARVVDVMALVEEIAFRRMDLRLAELLTRRSSQNRGAPGTITATHEELASELGTAREVVSRLLKDFERIGILRAGRGRIELLDETQLQRVVESLSTTRSGEGARADD